MPNAKSQGTKQVSKCSLHLTHSPVPLERSPLLEHESEFDSDEYNVVCIRGYGKTCQPYTHSLADQRCEIRDLAAVEHGSARFESLVDHAGLIANHPGD